MRNDITRAVQTFTVLLTLAFVVSLYADSVSAGRPATPLRPVEAGGKSRSTTSAPPSTSVVVGQVLGEWDFEDGSGGPDPQGWVSHDNTQQDGVFSHVDDFAGLGGGTFGRLTPLSGARSLWCGLRPGGCEYATLPGYLNSWDQRFQSIPFSTTGNVTVDYLIRYDTETNYDRVDFEYLSASGTWRSVAMYEGIGTETESVMIPADSLAGVAQLRFRFTSDPVFSDEDGFHNSDGAFIVDDITVQDAGGIVDVENFEGEMVGALATTDGDWSALAAPAYGDHAALFSGATVLQEDSVVTNTTHVWGFFNGSTADYDCAGHPEQPVVPYKKTIDGTEHFFENEIRSPMVSVLQDIGGNPVSFGTFKLLFDVYRDLPLDALVVYTYRVRSLVGGCWGAWTNEGFVYYGSQKEWFRHEANLTDVISPGATHIQVAIVAIDICEFYCGIQGTGLCHTHAPLVDNVEVVATFEDLVVTNTLNSGAGSLRQAIIDANAAVNPSRISFDIPGSGVQDIVFATALPNINKPVVIDATTQPGYTGVPLVRLVGTALSNSFHLLIFAGGDSDVRGLALFDAGGNGIRLASADNVVEACTFDGLDYGVTVAGSGNRVGGLLADQRNHFTACGVAVSVSSGSGNTIRGNEMTGMGANQMGIDLDPAGVALNDPLDADGGANLGQNYPFIISTNGPVGTIGGSLDSSANGTFTIDLYAAHCGSAGRSAGEVHLGTMQVTTDGSGHVDFTTTVAPFAPGLAITATATDANGNTSEFGRCYASLVVTNIADSGPGSLRMAIVSANASANHSTILFNISGTSVHTIRPVTPLPDVTTRTTIDGFSQPGTIPNSNDLWLGCNAALKIELDGSLLASGTGLRVTADSCLVRGLVVNDFPSAGIEIYQGDRNEVSGCYLGTNVTGSAAQPNFYGLHLNGGLFNTIGGTDPAERNVISGNENNGIHITFGSGNSVYGNFVGVDDSGTSALGNGAMGMFVYSSPENLLSENLVSANAQSGISFTHVFSSLSDCRVSRSRIGTDVTGTAPLGNGQHGVDLSVGNTGSGDPLQVGGSAPLGNLIAYNAGAGVRVVMPITVDAQKATVSYNTIHSNGKGIVVLNGVATMIRNQIGPNIGLGIDLNDNGVTANDALDADTGPNALQNFPIITGVTPLSNGTVRVAGTINSLPSTTYVLQFFRSATCDPSDHGEGEVFIGLVNQSTNASGTRSFSITGFPNMPGGSRVTALAHASTLTGTSEFSACFEYINTLPGTNVVADPVDQATGLSPVTLTFDNITTSGNTLLTIGDTGPPPPGGLTFGDDPTYYDLSTTATFTGSIDVCLAYSESSVSGLESELRVLHFDDTLMPPAWVDITASVDTVANVLCGTTTTLSPFAIAEPLQPTPVGDGPVAPVEFALHPNMPNPFNPVTTIEYDVPAGGARVSIMVFDVAGRRVRTLVEESRPAGQHRVTWDGRNDRGQSIASGVYFYRMSAGSFVQTRKMVLLK